MAKPSDKRDQYTAVLEDLRDQFRVFGEALIGVRDEVKELGKRVGRVETQLEQVGVELELVKSELGLIRHHQVTRDEFKLLETRVLRLEKQRR